MIKTIIKCDCCFTEIKGTEHDKYSSLEMVYVSGDPLIDIDYKSNTVKLQHLCGNCSDSIYRAVISVVDNINVPF